MAYSESDTRSKLIDPKIKASDWLESNIENYPTSDALFERKYGLVTPKAKDIITHPFHIEGTMQPRFYQQIAVQKTIEAISDGRNRVLLTLATYTTPKNNLLNSYFLMYSLRKNLDILVSSAKGTAQKGIYLKSIKKLEIVDVPLNIQKKTVNYLDKVSKEVEKLKQEQQEKMHNLQTLKASILDQAFRGKL